MPFELCNRATTATSLLLQKQVLPPLRNQWFSGKCAGWATSRLSPRQPLRLELGLTTRLACEEKPLAVLAFAVLQYVFHDVNSCYTLAWI